MTTATRLIDLPEAQIKEVKNRLMTDGLLLERQKTAGFDVKFFEHVTVANRLIKGFILVSLGLYLLLNLAAIIVAIVKDTLSDPIGNVIGVLAISFIVYAIFSNINTNKQKELNPLLIVGDNFVFNFNDEVVVSENLFYSLPSDSLKKIELIIHDASKGQIFGGVTFTFDVLGYQVQHALRFTNLTEITDCLKSKFPSLLDCLVIDGQGTAADATVNRQAKLKYQLTAVTILVAALLLFIIPYALHYYSIALTMAAAILLLTAVLVGWSHFLAADHLVAGLVISSIFIIIGFAVPLLVVEISSTPFWQYLLSDSEILLPTIFGIIGLGLYWYSIVLIINKLKYKLSHKTVVGGK